MSNDSQRRQLNAAIDRAVHDMMQIDPRPGLRRRVLSRLERSGRPTLAAGRYSWMLLPAAVVMILAAALMYGRSGQTQPELRGAHAGTLRTLRTPRTHRTLCGSFRTPPQWPALAAGRTAIPFSVRAAIASLQRPSTTPPAPPPRRRDPPSLTHLPHLFRRSSITPLSPLSEIRLTPLEIQPLTVPALLTATLNEETRCT